MQVALAAGVAAARRRLRAFATLRHDRSPWRASGRPAPSAAR
jgi:hypothetical protein